MTPEGDQVDEQVRLAVEALPHAPVRWDRVARRSRRRRWVTLAALALVGFILTVVVAISLVAGKSAIDPSYSPPLLSRGGSSADFDEPAFGHGLTPLSKFQPISKRAATGGEKLDSSTLGYVFKVSLAGDIDESEALWTRWRIRHRGSSKALPLTVLPSAQATTKRGGSDDVFEVWIQEPPRSGQFVVDFSLMSPDGTVANDTSSPLHVVTHGFLHRYTTPTYAAGVPRGWHVDSDYDPEPEHRFVTRLQGPHEMSVLVDTTPGVSGDPADSAANLEAFLEGGEEPYKRLSFARRNFGGPAFEWCFELGDHVSTDIFFYRGGDGYAVLAESPESHFREARLVARAVTRSLRNRAS